MEPSYIKEIHLVFLLILLLNLVIADSQPNYFFTACDENGNYTQNSLYQTNLHQLLSDLTAQPSQTDFYNTTIGESPDRVYGTFYCRRDITPEFCNDCVRAAAQMIVTNCTREKEAVVWYQECTLRYANRQIMGLDEDDALWSRWFSPGNVSNPNQLESVLSTTMSDLIQKAAYNDSFDGYATGEAPFPPYPIVYSLVQCSPDILGLPCERCLRRLYRDMQFCCNGGRLWIMMFQTSCQMRYDMVPFYTPLAPPPPPPPTPTPTPTPSPSQARGIVFYIVRAGVPGVGFVLIVVGIMVFFACRRKKRQKHIAIETRNPPSVGNDAKNSQSSNTDSLQYSLDAIKYATMNFSIENKLGEGGFGAVYKGRFPDGQEVAVKRLSEDSRQGLREFTNEVQLLANLQHRNLVKLLGFCAEGEEKLLIYEFVSNLSLDKFLFDPNKRKYLDWETRFKIVIGIARGLLYLHVDSRVKIIHRDLKASNILLDEEMNAKIADFGTAKLMKIDHTQANTSKIFGTFGYMAPEYAVAGVFSTKSDVYSFGVILLEIISGQSNNMFSRSFGQDSLINYAGKLWISGKILELVDPSLESNLPRAEVLRCIQVGLFCVQEDPSSRPTMDSVLLILQNNSSDVQFPPHPSAASSGTNTRSEHITGEQDQDGSKESNQPYDRNSSTEFTDLYPR